MRGLAMIVVAAGIVCLSGCALIGPLFGVNDGYRATHRWLDDQPIVVEVTETNAYYKDSELVGELHAELAPAATMDQIEAFASGAVDFLATQDSYNVNLSAGRDGVDFAIRDDVGVTEGLRLWQTLDVDHIADVPTLLVDPAAYHDSPAVDGARVIARAPAQPLENVLDELRARVPQAELQVQAYQEDAVLDEMVANGSYYESAISARGIPTVRMAAECVPATGVQDIAAEVVRAGAGGRLDLCEGWSLDYSGAPIGDAAIALRAQLDAAGVTLPVSMTSRTPIPNAQVRTVAVTPGTAQGLQALHDLDAPSALGELAGYTLDEARDLSVLSFDQPVSELVDVVAGSPGADALGVVELRGETFAVAARVADIAEAAAAADELVASTDVLDYFDAGLDEVAVALADHPAEADVRAFARALYDSGLATGRELDVDPGRDERSADWFRDEWAAL